MNVPPGVALVKFPTCDHATIVTCIFSKYRQIFGDKSVICRQNSKAPSVSSKGNYLPSPPPRQWVCRTSKRKISMLELFVRPCAESNISLLCSQNVPEFTQYVFLAYIFARFPEYVLGGGAALWTCASVSSHAANPAGTSSLPVSSASIHDSSH